MGDNSFGKLMFVLGVLVIALLTLFFWNWWHLAWLVVFIVGGLLCWRWDKALFWFFLVNVVIGVLWALKLRALGDRTLILFLIALVSAAGFVASAASLSSGSSKEGAGAEAASKSEKKSAEKSEAKKSSAKKSSKRSASKSTPKRASKKGSKKSARKSAKKSSRRR